MILIIASVRGVRKVTTQRRRSNPDRGPSTTWAVVPPTPLLEQAYWGDVESGGDNRATQTAKAQLIEQRIHALALDEM